MHTTNRWLFPITALLLIVHLFIPTLSHSADSRLGTIKGRVVDAETRMSIPGASVQVTGTERGAATDPEGQFTVADVPAGSYVVRIQSLGYDPQALTDVIVRSARATFVTVDLQPSAVQMDEVVVKGGFFSAPEEKQSSTISYSTEEIRRAPGSAGDVSRILMSLPSIAKVNDMTNSLIVRGGNPSENAFYLDNIEIPNINHFPLQGSSGGPIGLINVDFIDDVTFSTGGFPALYGDRLSSVMELKFRDGNRDEIDAQLDMNFAGFGAQAEGPLPASRGSWLFSARRSYLDLIVDAIGVGVAPRYSDYQGKMTLDLGTSHTLSILGLAGNDYIEFDKEQAEEDGNIVYGKWEGYEYAAGATWEYVWGGSGYSTTSLSTLGTQFNNDFFETSTDSLLVNDEVFEGAIQLRNRNHLRLSPNHRLELGMDIKRHHNSYKTFLASYPNSIGDTVPELRVDQDVNAVGAGLFASHEWRIGDRLAATFGLRFDYFDYNQRGHLSPRLSLSYDFNERTSLTGATGIYFQNLPLSLLAQREANLDINDPMSIHYVFSARHLVTDNTRVTLEGYYKDYRDFPLDPLEPQLFIGDELVYRMFFGNHETLVDDGRARSYGVELTVRKKLVQGLYGLVAAALSKSEYRDFDGVWRDRVFDNRITFSVEGGYKPNRKWEFSARWLYAGGAPVTPLDLEASEAHQNTVLDATRVNEDRFPDYHSLNLRVDRRFHFSGSNLIVYLSVWNAYDRQNVSQYYWNAVENRPDTLYQWSMIPILGLEFEF